MTIDLDRHSVIDLTTEGRVTGRPHTIEIWFAQQGSTLYLLSGGGTRPDWVRNLTCNQAVRVRAGDNVYAGKARLVIAPHEERLARNSVHDKYAASYRGDLTGWRETSLPIALDLDPGWGG